MIDVICPSRGRPEYCREMVESVRYNAKSRVRILVGIDEDDPSRSAYEKLDWIDLRVYPRSRSGCVDVVNNLAAESTAELVQFMGDDCLMVTEGWDERLLAAMPEDGIAVVCGMNKEGEVRAQPYHPSITRGWLDIVGWYAMPGITHYGMDAIIARMAKSIGRLLWVENVVIEHRHYKRHPRGIKPDDLYQRNEVQAVGDDTYIRAHKHIYEEKIEQLRKAIG